jgi:hypothetical protein
VDNACVLDAHFTAFFVNDADLDTVSFNADSVPVDRPLADCK